MADRTGEGCECHDENTRSYGSFQLIAQHGGQKQQHHHAAARADEPADKAHARAGQITTAGFPPRKTDDLRMYWEWLQYFSARPGREEYYDWAVVRYWKIFYQFWCQSDAAGNLPEVRPKFMAHKKHLDAILPDILASKYLPLGEKLRAAAFCASPTLTYGAAAAWGRLHTRKGK